MVVTTYSRGSVVGIRVRDTGVGIAAEEHGRIFDPFVQVQRGLTKTVEGTGLGLAISRDLARGMGGELRVESEKGRGSTFVVELAQPIVAAGGDGPERSRG